MGRQDVPPERLQAEHFMTRRLAGVLPLTLDERIGWSVWGEMGRADVSVDAAPSDSCATIPPEADGF